MHSHPPPFITEDLRECRDSNTLTQLVNELIQAGHIHMRPDPGIAFENLKIGDLVLVRGHKLRTVANRENPWPGPYGSSWVRIHTDQGEPFVGRSYETVHRYRIS